MANQKTTGDTAWTLVAADPEDLDLPAGTTHYRMTDMKCRLFRPDDMSSQDFQEDRLNIYLKPGNRIGRVDIG